MEKYLREVALRCITCGEVIRPVVLQLQIYIRAPHERRIATAARMSTCKDTLQLITLAVATDKLTKRPWLESRYRHSKILLREPAAHMFVWGPLTHAH